MALDVAKQFDALFRGHRNAHGVYSTERYSPDKRKMEISHNARTVRGPVTTELWSDHLEGRSPLGIVPIDEDWRCHWGAIDVDEYDIDHVQLIKKVAHLPLVVCRTKSGGAHLFLFCEHSVPADLMQSALRSIAASLALGKSEIFPKQTTVMAERGDVGNWLNMPYYGGDSARVALRHNGLGMTEEEFLKHAENCKVDDTFLNEWASTKPKSNLAVTQTPPPGAAGPGDENDPLYHAPPCLQHLCANGFPPGTGNNGFVNLCIYLKRRWPDDWVDKAEKYATQYFVPARPRAEVADVIKRLRIREYQYKCRESPIVDVCRSDLCRTRKFGVGLGSQVPKISGMSVLDSDPPLWFVDVDGRRVELRTEDLQIYHRFQRVCMEQLHVAFLNMKQADWIEVLNAEMAGLVKIEAPLDVGDRGRFNELFAEFATNRRMAHLPDEMRAGMVWLDEETNEYCFQFNHLMAFLEQERFNRFNRVEISQRVREMGGRDGVVMHMASSGRPTPINCWRVPVAALNP